MCRRVNSIKYGTKIIKPIIEAHIEQYSTAPAAKSFAYFASSLYCGLAKSTTRSIALFTISKEMTAIQQSITISISTFEILKKIPAAMAAKPIKACIFIFLSTLKTVFSPEKAFAKLREKEEFFTTSLLAIVHLRKENEMVNDFDTAILRFFSNLSTPVRLDNFILLWTDNLQHILILLTVILFLFKTTRKSAVTGAIAMILSPLLVERLWKNIFQRIRPYEQFEWAKLIGPPSTTYSFPSGHSSFAFAAAFSLCFYSPKWARILLISSAVFTAFTRVYLGIHYATDVLAGALHGVLVAVISYYIVDIVSKLIFKNKTNSI